MAAEFFEISERRKLFAKMRLWVSCHISWLCVLQTSKETLGLLPHFMDMCVATNDSSRGLGMFFKEV